MEGAEVTLVARPPSSKIRLASVAALIGGYAILFGLYEILLPVSSRCLVGLLSLTLVVADPAEGKVEAFSAIVAEPWHGDFVILDDEGVDHLLVELP